MALVDNVEQLPVLALIFNIGDIIFTNKDVGIIQKHFLSPDYMWSAVKDPLESPASFDRDGLQLAFKYFTSSTLTMRLAGISQINNHINLYGEVSN